MRLLGHALSTAAGSSTACRSRRVCRRRADGADCQRRRYDQAATRLRTQSTRRGDRRAPSRAGLRAGEIIGVVIDRRRRTGVGDAGRPVRRARRPDRASGRGRRGGRARSGHRGDRRRRRRGLPDVQRAIPRPVLDADRRTVPPRHRAVGGARRGPGGRRWPLALRGRLRRRRRGRRPLRVTVGGGGGARRPSALRPACRPGGGHRGRRSRSQCLAHGSDRRTRRDARRGAPGEPDGLCAS